MKNIGLFKIIAVAAVLALPTVSAPVFAQSAGAKSKPLRGVVRPAPRRGGYSYKYLQGVDTRKFTDPTKTEQTVGGPFDNGFFFSSPTAPRGGDSPYMQ
ncbi:MAG: hypothetical protein K2Y42_14660 [Hyphomicrobium sp.]|jgi:hypothetical protein|uniref:hypothetical protein n=1 Tax=Hyphomicrobium sp. TaxID=82 RepID=UPI0025C18A9E|nr:hypothetical protein [Hyphomicrobium sp.]MBX9863984.1 hypothetical protein [Hyphomicrobium sp.]